MATLNFKVADVKDDSTPLPSGTYDATITSADMAASKAGDEMLKIRFEVTGPSHAGMSVFENVLLTHSNANVVQMGQRKLRQIAVALGLQELNDTDQLIDRKVKIVTKVEEPKAGSSYGPSARIVRVLEASASGDAAPAAKPAASSNDVPW